MNREQVKYMRERIAVIVKNKILAIEQATKLPKSCLTIEEKFKQIKDGTSTLKPMTNFNCYTKLHEAYTYKDDAKLSASYDSAKKSKEKEIAKIHNEEKILIDEIMLGDAEQALIKLREFESK